MQIVQPVPRWLFAAVGVAGGWVLFQWLSPDPSIAAQAAAPAAAPMAAPPTTTIVVLPVAVPGPAPGQPAPVDQPSASARVPRQLVATIPAAGTKAPHTQLVLAQDGSIIVVGDAATLTANTGSTSSSGAVVLNSQDSTVSSGTSTLTGLVGTTATGGLASSTSGSPATTAAPAQLSASTYASQGSTSIGPVDPIVAALGNALALQLTGRPVAMAGYEDHSVSLFGNDQIITYDDSNVFINRNGQLNSNTGDTDSSGLNAVDVVDSVVRSGDHTEDGDDEDNGDDGEEEEEPEEEEDLALQAGGPPDSGVTASTMTRQALASTTIAADTATSVDPDASSSATGRNPLVIGADGYDDVSIRSTGNRNIVTYDDSNVVIGGTGPVNAQIGDSDTSGAVVMGIRGSDVRSGAST